MVEIVVPRLFAHGRGHGSPGDGIDRGVRPGVYAYALFKI